MIGEEIQSHRFTLPVNQILTMLVLTGLVAVGVYLIYPSLDEVFLGIPLFERRHSCGVRCWPVDLLWSRVFAVYLGQLDRGICPRPARDTRSSDLPGCWYPSPHC